MEQEIILNDETYILNKVKQKDEGFFLQYCLMNGEVEVIKGWINKIMFLFPLPFNPPLLEMPITKEYIIANKFFRKRREINEAKETHLKLSNYKK